LERGWQLAPDDVLLDGQSSDGYGSCWQLAMMFTAHIGDLDKARTSTSGQSSAARFAGVVAKPFEQESRFEAVARAILQDEGFVRRRIGPGS
jgi:hypothetical protein